MYSAEIYGFVTEVGWPVEHLIGYGAAACPRCHDGIQGPIYLQMAPPDPSPGPALEYKTSPSAITLTEALSQPNSPGAPKSRALGSAARRSQGPFVCDKGCGKGFHRREHLRRHERMQVPPSRKRSTEADSVKKTRQRACLCLRILRQADGSLG